VEEELPSINEVHEHVHFWFRLEGEGKLHDERVVYLRQDISFSYKVFNVDYLPIIASTLFSLSNRSFRMTFIAKYLTVGWTTDPLPVPTVLLSNTKGDVAAAEVA
jgi:hypothetical protein